VLVTNAHQQSIDIKMRRTRLGGHLERVICAHDLALPKESPAFWQRLSEVEPFDPARTLFIDDNLDVLRSARSFGMRWLLCITEPDSRKPAHETDEFPAIGRFSRLLPQLA
jgi:putative hydrolase of the HAD superfamily